MGNERPVSRRVHHVIGALFGNVPCDRFGRKITLIATGLLFLVSAIGSAIAPDPYSLSILRFIGGLGVGVSSIVVFLMPETRGRTLESLAQDLSRHS